MEMSIVRNVALASLRRLQPLRPHPPRGRARASPPTGRARLQVKYGRLSNPMTSLSGGNQQKVVLAKWLSAPAALLIVDEPTRGIDVGTKAEVHRLLEELAARGRRRAGDLVRAARGAAAGRPDPRHARGPPGRPSSPTTRRPRRRSWPRPPARPRRMRRSDGRHRVPPGEPTAQRPRARGAWSISSSASASSGSSSCSRCS